MYADRYGTGPQIKPGSAGLALAMTALPVVALIAGLQISQSGLIDKTFEAYPVRDDPPPPPDPIKPEVRPDSKKPIIETPYVPPIDPVLPTDNKTKTATEPPLTPPPTYPPTEPGLGNGGIVIEPPKPVTIDARIDPRYANALQPPYPPEEIRAGNNGRVVVRVRIGADGRVKEVVRVSAASDAFYAAAERQALAKWRFKPATRDGVAIEQWKQMSLSFVLNKDD